MKDNKMKKVISKDKIKVFFIVLMLFPVFEPKIFTQYTSTTLIFSCLNFVILIGLIMNFFKYNKLISIICILWIIYRLWLLVAMVINNNFSGILQWGYLSLVVLELIFIFEKYNQQNQKQLLEGIVIITTIFLFINLITLFMFPRGIIESSFYEVTDGDIYFLGIKTQFTTMIIPGVSAIMLLYNSDKKMYKKKLYLFLILALSNIFIKNISTAIVGLILLLVLFFVQKFTTIKLNAVHVIVLAFIIHILIVFFSAQTLFSTFINGLLHKDVTLSSRSYIWENAKMELMNEEPFKLLFGLGTIENNNYIYYGGGYWQPHNQLLVWLFSSGIFGTIYILFFLYCLLRKRKQFPQKNYYLNLQVCFVILIMSVTEVYFDTAICYVPFLIMYYMTDYIYTQKCEERGELTYE